MKRPIFIASRDKLIEFRIKHLEMLQALIGRMAGNSAALKNWCLSLVTAICGLAISLKEPAISVAALLPILIFAMLDAQYLRNERRFRALFEIVRTENWGKPPNFSIRLKDAPKLPYWKPLFSWSILFFYFPLALGVVAVMLIAGYLNGFDF